MVPFHDLWTDGGETEKRPPCPPHVTEPAQTHGSYFWDTTLVGRNESRTYVDIVMDNTQSFSKDTIKKSINEANYSRGTSY
jgi:hypothetical protein